MEINKVATDPTLNLQEQRWELMSVLGMKWKETGELNDEDRNFLLSKIERIKDHIKSQNNNVIR
tara:strand:+ start:6475 stop:6666 length:192 start_codon:yes stop_codon:yes gene_type:complete